MREVKIWEEKLKIPTYEIGRPDENPMFYEKRVYQGSSGKVYPLPVIDKIYDEKVIKEYNVVWIENEYIKVMIMPELGGRIQRALDKTNNYDFVYYNQVIKPALVGLAGPWISGGIEFNWPQHHRPSTFDPVDYKITENEDGSKTVWVNEIDRMYGTKALTGFTLHEGKSYIEISGQLFNGTDTPQTFLWWANPAVSVSDHTKSIFPPDVHAVFDHGKRDVSRFPIATGVYYKVDYSEGVDIGRYKNIPVPTSYMAYHSDYNFVGGYDYSVEAGILHVANHHISPGKKQWTWGNGDFGKAWDRNLTDEDGPYIELMTGVYTDNQPDFTWLKPYEEKSFKQYFMPYKIAREVKNATIDVIINLELSSYADIVVYTTSKFENLRVILKNKEEIIYEDIISEISPLAPYSSKVKLDKYERHNIKMSVFDNEGKLLVDYQEAKEEILQTPESAKPSKSPEKISTNEELFLTGLHLEQYRHATYLPEDYYLEGLKRDSSDTRINNAYGSLLYRRGLFSESEKYFETAVERLLWKNPNPYDGEPLYNLGLSLKMQGKLDEAFDKLYKSTWNDAMQNSAFYQLACIASIKGEYEEALELADKSIIKHYHNIKSRNLKVAMLRRLRRNEEALNFVRETIKIDILDYVSRNELYLLNNAPQELTELNRIMRDYFHNYLETAIEYGNAGLYEEAINVLERLILNRQDIYPMVYYYLGYYYNKTSSLEKAKEFYLKAENTDKGVCFPNRITSILVLEDAMEVLPEAYMAPYYLGNLFYDKKVYDKAISLWERSRSLNDKFPTVHRNLGLAYYNKSKDYESAQNSLEKAYSLNKDDSRVFYELDQLYKRLNKDASFRLEKMEENYKVMEIRDDFFLEYVTLKNSNGDYNKALDLLMKRIFHVWEGGEGRVAGQYILAHTELGKEAIKKGEYDLAINHLNAAKVYPDNLGEGKLISTQENILNYYLGVSYKQKGDKDKREKYFKLASVGLDEPTAAMYYNDQPADTIFYQGLALRELGLEKEARGRFNKLYAYGEKHIFDDVKIDYFAVSLPNFLIYEEDLIKSNKVHCRYLMSLGLIGYGEKDMALVHLDLASKLDINHQGIKTHLNELQ